MKKFYQKWDKGEIKKYLKVSPVLVLFKVHINLGEAEIKLHGNLSERNRALLQVSIANEFGGILMSEKLCVTINEFAEQWYYRFAKPRKIRVLNFGKKGS